MKTTLDLPDELVKALKLRAIHEGKKLKDAVADALRAGLKARAGGAGGKGGRQRSGRPVVKKDRRTGAPVIRCPSDAPARRMTAGQLHHLEHRSQTREDLERLGLPVRH